MLTKERIIPENRRLVGELIAPYNSLGGTWSQVGVGLLSQGTGQEDSLKMMHQGRLRLVVSKHFFTEWVI